MRIATLAFVAAAGFVLAGSQGSPAARSTCPGFRSVVLIDARTGAVHRAFPSPDGTVGAAVADSNGGWFVGGWFRRVGRIARPALAHLDQHGRLDRRFRAQPTFPAVSSLTRVGTVLYAGGPFGVAAVDSRTGLRLWTTRITAPPSFRSYVTSLAVGNGAVYAVGTFTSIGGVARDGVVALDPHNGRTLNWTVDTTWGGRRGNPLAVAVAPDIVYIGGEFDRLGRRARENLGAVDASTGRATAWVPGHVGGPVETIFLTHNEVIVGGHGGFAALDARTGRALGWTKKLQGTATRFATSGSNVFLGGGLRDGFMSVAGRRANNLAAVRLPSGRFTRWTPYVNVETGVNTLAVSGRTVLAGGIFARTLSC